MNAYKLIIISFGVAVLLFQLCGILVLMWRKLAHEAPAALYYIAGFLLLITPPILYGILAWVMK